MAVPSPWPVTNLTMYGNPLTCAMIFGISKCVELAKLGLFAKFHAQLVHLVASQAFKTHQGTHCRSHHSVIFQL